MTDIPKPPTKKLLKEDLREKYLNGWVDLFSSIHKDIKIIKPTSPTFSNELQDVIGDIKFEYWCENPYIKILVLLPPELELQYLIGLDNNKMFSQREVSEDPLINENYSTPCSPELKSWSKFYFELCKIYNKVIKNIPPPPKI